MGLCDHDENDNSGHSVLMIFIVSGFNDYYDEESFKYFYQNPH